MKKHWILQLSAMAVLALPANAQQDHQHHQHGDMAKDKPATPSDQTTNYLLGLSSGTSVNPRSWNMPMVMTHIGDWNLMWMGQAFVVNTQQSGPRGADKLYSPNWGMLAAAHKLGGGTLMLRGMLSLDPVTVTHRSYPLLFQTGETAFGKPLVDAQHPHDFLMELGIHYARPIGERALWHVYYAPVGDPAMGPVAFPHRASAMELPQATLGHHWQDSTHIANNVLTAGLQYGTFRLEASGFRGREPNENRWNIDMGPMDSWSGRLTWQPTRNWIAQVSTGRLKNPEATHETDITRTTASVHYTRDIGNDKKQWSSSMIWARNYKSIGQYGTHSVLGETVYPLSKKNLLTGRVEWSQRDELFANDHDLEHELFDRTGQRSFRVVSTTAGYTRELGSFSAVHLAAGFNVTVYSIADALKPYYGSTPKAASVFLRARLHSLK
jgi:hypothetical protein